MMQGRSQPRHRRASGMSLIELLAALMIAAAVSALGVHYLRPTGESSKQRSCDLTRALLQNDAQRFLEANGRLPRTDLQELRTTKYAGATLPACPVTSQSYRLNRQGVVACPTHEATR